MVVQEMVSIYTVVVFVKRPFALIIKRVWCLKICSHVNMHISNVMQINATVDVELPKV